MAVIDEVYRRVASIERDARHVLRRDPAHTVQGQVSQLHDDLAWIDAQLAEGWHFPPLARLVRDALAHAGRRAVGIATIGALVGAAAFAGGDPEQAARRVAHFVRHLPETALSVLPPRLDPFEPNPGPAHPPPDGSPSGSAPAAVPRDDDHDREDAPAPHRPAVTAAPPAKRHAPAQPAPGDATTGDAEAPVSTVSPAPPTTVAPSRAAAPSTTRPASPATSPPTTSGPPKGDGDRKPKGIDDPVTSSTAAPETTAPTTTLTPTAG